jgi:hypothetical protein
MLEVDEVVETSIHNSMVARIWDILLQVVLTNLLGTHKVKDVVACLLRSRVKLDNLSPTRHIRLLAVLHSQIRSRIHPT